MKNTKETLITRKKVSSSGLELEALFNVGLDVMMLISPDFEIVRINPTGCKILGKKEEYFIGKICYKVMHGMDHPIDGCPCKKIKLGEAGVGEITQSGMHFIATASPIINDNNEITGFAHTIKNITERKKAEIEIKKINELKSVLLTSISHELKTPLSVINGFTELLIIDHGYKLDTGMKNIVSEISNGCNRLKKLVGGILEASRLKSTKIQLELAKTNLASLIREVAKGLEGFAKTRNLEVEVDISDELIVIIDVERITDVIGNLTTNAIKYTPSNGKIIIQSEIKEEQIVISIKDTGIGFTEVQKEIVFKEFGKIERNGQGLDNTSKGFGLGLYLSKKIIEMHDGRIWMESEGLNKGSAFFFSLPFKRIK